MKHQLMIVSLFVGFLAAVSPALATTITYDAVIPATSPDNPFTPTFQKFDPSLGTLKSVSVNFNLTMTPKLSFFGMTDSTTPVTVHFVDRIRMNNDQNSSLLTMTDPYGTVYTAPAVDANYGGSVTYSAPMTYTAPMIPGSVWFTSSPVLSFAPTVAVPTNHLADFIGTTGTATLNCTTYAMVRIDFTVLDTTIPKGNGTYNMASGGGDDTMQGTATIAYDYTVPEPATMSLLGIGLLTLLRRRKK